MGGDNIWDSVRLATAGFSNPTEWRREFGVDRKIVGFVWHSMEGHIDGAIDRWNTGVADAHLCILESGVIVLSCLLENIAWHAGTNNDPTGGQYGRTPFWRQNNANPMTVGVELEGFAGKPFTDAQIEAVRKIALWGESAYGVPRKHTFDQFEGHHSHGELSSSRTDPGSTFDWGWVTD